MTEGRPAIPAAIKRDVLVEAGHRCAIPTCRSVPVELAHIEPWSKVQEHTYDNLIALCPTCHTRYDRGDIDRKSMQQYKRNLSIVSSRYSDLERRVLEAFGQHPEADQILLPGGMDLLMHYVVADGLMVTLEDPTGEVLVMGMPQTQIYGLTEKGRAFVSRWFAADPIE